MSTQHVVGPKIYILVFATLIALTISTVGIANVDLGPLNTIAALAIAAIKASLVILFFMHVRYSRPLIGLVVFASLLWLAILITLTLSDFASRPWTQIPRGL
ncbi:MAG TPA: cytochrome C oxidase subunit IV family protein [Acidobacteriota bacterium]|nr:cytochrome C oxidase subunit IV family protein [Acidobacteriota bacterium]